jgi:hypothetical protein
MIMTLLHPTFRPTLPDGRSRLLDAVDTIDDTLHASLVRVGDHVRIDRDRFEPLTAELARLAHQTAPPGSPVHDLADRVGDTFLASWVLPVIGGPWIQRERMVELLRSLRAMVTTLPR